MKILHFLWSLAQGGAENLAVDLANEQCRNHQVVMLVANKSVDESVRRMLDPSVRFVHLGRPEGSRNPYWIVRLLTAIHWQRPDVVHAHASNLASLARFLATPLVLTVHANNVRVSPHAHRFSAICCISRSVESDIRQRYPHLTPRLVENGVKTAAIAARSAQLAPSRPLRAVQVSRMVHSTKGQDLVIEALARLNQGRKEPFLTVDFIGQGPSMAFLTDLAARMKVDDCCRFLGSVPRDEVFAVLQNYDILIQPSRDEGFGLTVAEGMAAKLAVVVSDLPGPMEVIGDGRYGYHFRSDDVESLAATLRMVASEFDRPESGQRVDAARQFVEDTYDLSKTSARYVHIYEEVASA
jgi:glycosyltransferase involved in cell wall biosynthesis